MLNEENEADAITASIIDDDDEEEIFEINHDKPVLPSVRKKQSWRNYNWCGKFLKTLGLSAAFLALGLCLAVPGPTLLDLKERVGTTIERISYIFTARSLGYLFGSILGGFLFDHFDQQLQLSYTLLLTSIATIAVPWCTSLIVLAVMISFQGIAMGVLDTGGNVFCIRIWSHQSGPYLQAMHFTFGIATGRGLSIFLARCLLPSWMLIANILLVLLASLILSIGLNEYQDLLWPGTLLFGLGLSSIFPTGMSWAEHYMTVTGKATAVLIMGSALGEMVRSLLSSTVRGPRAMGAVGQSCSTRSGQGGSRHCHGPSLRPSCQWPCEAPLWSVRYRGPPGPVGAQWLQSSQHSALSRGGKSVPPISPSVAPCIRGGGFEESCFVLHWSHCRLDAIVPPSYVPCLSPKGDQGSAVHGVPQSRPLIRSRVSGPRGCPLVHKQLDKLLHKVYLAHLADINARIPLLLVALEPLGLEPDLAAHQGMVCIAVRAVKLFLSGDTADGGCQLVIKLVLGVQCGRECRGIHTDEGDRTCGAAEVESKESLGAVVSTVFSRLFLTAKHTLCWPGSSGLFSLHPMKTADRGGTTPHWLGAAILKFLPPTRTTPGDGLYANRVVAYNR
ncbi:NAGLT1 [Acanthosepion pharaonis]|uniref:NAGLT1 n=1 Tax=Acanthosepion pharaonis TaxID=158019 RepID=A0A812C7I6_ACAPH|nr:NAGLT1 [Sepia pharaonis]